MQVDMDASGVPMRNYLFKGKSGRRGWALLPKEILHHVVNFYATDILSAPLPLSLANTSSTTRQIYICARVASSVLPLLAICRKWSIALTDHVVWSKICLTLDHHEEIASWMKNKASSKSDSGHLRYEHYRVIRMYICVPCRMMNPQALIGYGGIKHRCNTSETGIIGLCHWHEPDRVCGHCLLADNPRKDYSEFYISRNDDSLTFPGIEATCYNCRKDALYGRAAQDSSLLDVIRDMSIDRNLVDWEIRQTYESFLEFGSVTVAGLIAIVREKTWLRRCTKLIEYLDQAVASVRYENREEGYDTEDEISEDEDVMCIQEDAGVRDIAIADYCRTRILEGNWFSPMDAYSYSFNRWSLPNIKSKHPFPYMRKQGETHPSSESIHSPPPPTKYLAERLAIAYNAEMRKVLRPALNNLVRKLSLECLRDRVDPCVKVAKFTVDDIIEGLRDEGVWWDDYDWSARWEEDAKRSKLSARQSGEEEETTSSNSSSEGSIHSHQTSPVLSTSTLQTTPSPPPPADGEPTEKKRTVPSSTKKQPTVVRYIPLIPESTDATLLHSNGVVEMLWREAASVLFHCKCTICLRAMRAEIANAAAVAAADVANSNLSDSSILTSDDFDDTDEGMDLEDAIALERRLNSHIVVPHYTADNFSARAIAAARMTLQGQNLKLQQQPVRKRSSEEVEEEEEGPEFEFEFEEEESSSIQGDYVENVSSNERAWISPRKGSSPPISMKRIKLSESKDEVAHISIRSVTPTRKRSSEEMESETGLDYGNDVRMAGIQDMAHKKVRSQE